jgi:hypothetical protein
MGWDVGLPMDDVVFLNSIYRGRYPTEESLLPYGEPSCSDAEKAISAAKTLVERLRSIL